MTNNITPIGDRVVVRKIENKSSTNDLGIILPNFGEKNENVWGEIVSLPEITENIWIKTMKIGDKLLYKQFQTDEFTDDKSNDTYVVIECQNNLATQKGQIYAIIHK